MSLKKINPPYLRSGDQVAIISPSFVIDEEKVMQAASVIESWGLKVVTGRNAFKSNGPFAGTDEERLADLQEMTDRRDIKAVICSRGGYGISRIIGRADFTSLGLYPKWYVGFSDITVLHLWLSEKAQMVSIHGEMPLNFSDPGKSPETLESLKDCLFGKDPSIGWKSQTEGKMAVSGEFTGGNLSLLYSLLGTGAEPPTAGKILFIEDTGEYFYHLDRMMISLKMAGMLDGLAALVVGGMNGMLDGKVPWGKSAEETISDVVSGCNYPVFFNFPAGHISDNRAVFIGREAILESNSGDCRLTFI